jgi:DNA-binding NarL/FixJ family response regulator
MEGTKTKELSHVHNYIASSEDVIRVVLVDSREAMREGLRQMLSGDESIKVIGEAQNAKEALSQIQKLYPDIVILDAEIGGAEGIKVVNQINQSLNHVGIIVLNDERNFLVPAIENGASAFLSRDIGRNELIAAIRIIYLWHSILFQDEHHFTLVRL